MLQRQTIDRDYYLSFRRQYGPDPITLVIVAELPPPSSGKYFYDATGTVNEPLFAALMLQLRFAPTSKKTGLRKFQKRGWVLVDATYEPVNVGGKDPDRVITRDYHLLRDDLAAMLPTQSIPIVLVKANVCRLLEPKLTQDGFHVLNHGRVVYFPSTGRQKDFQRQFSKILKKVC